LVRIGSKTVYGLSQRRKENGERESDITRDRVDARWENGFGINEREREYRARVYVVTPSVKMGMGGLSVSRLTWNVKSVGGEVMAEESKVFTTHIENPTDPSQLIYIVKMGGEDEDPGARKEG